MKTAGRKIAKLVISSIAGMGASAITTGVLNGMVKGSKEMKRSAKLLCSIGTIVVGAMVGDAAEKYMDETVGGAYQFIDSLRGIKAESEEENG